MTTDVLILNTLVLDLRSRDFEFAAQLAGPGGVVKCPPENMPDYSQEQYKAWIDQGCAAAGGPGNTAPLMARAGLNVSVGGNLGAGTFDGLDAQGRAFRDILEQGGVDVSSIVTHPTLPTATTFIHDSPDSERGGIVFFPCACDDFDFEQFMPAVDKLQPRIVYYMYSGLSERGDANGGQDLADFTQQCREHGCITTADSHTLTGNPAELIGAGTPVEAYRLLEPLLPQLDIFFTSADEAKMIVNTLEGPRDWGSFSEEDNVRHALQFLFDRFRQNDDRACLFGVTVSDGAYSVYAVPKGQVIGPEKTQSQFMSGDVVDLVGAGDSFRAGMLTYVAKNADAFREGTLSIPEAIQMGCLMASLYIKAPMNDRYGNIQSYDKLLNAVRSNNS